MAFSRVEIQSNFVQLNAGGAVISEFYFPRGARIKRYFAVPSVAQAAHSTIVDDVVFVNAGAVGDGTTVLATLTNDSDIAATIAIKEGAWVAHHATELITENRPASPTALQNDADVIAVGGVIKATLTGAGTTPTANWFTIGVEYVISA
jgi:hypothetical protein